MLACGRARGPASSGGRPADICNQTVLTLCAVIHWPGVNVLGILRDRDGIAFDRAADAMREGGIRSWDALLLSPYALSPIGMASGFDSTAPRLF